jgi:hypothetical protein
MADLCILNQLKNARYPTVLCRFTQAKDIFDHNVMMRLVHLTNLAKTDRCAGFTREAALLVCFHLTQSIYSSSLFSSVGGIPVIEHFEVNVVPVNVEVTERYLSLVIFIRFIALEGFRESSSPFSSRKRKVCMFRLVARF